MKVLGLFIALLIVSLQPIWALDTPEKIVTYQQPIIDLQFQNGVLDSRITFARSSAANYFNANGVMQSASSGVPRFSSIGPAGGQVGFFLEGTATNLDLWSRDLTQTAWLALNGTVAKDQIGLDGVANSASSFAASANNATVCQSTILSSASRTYSTYIKRLVGSGAVDISNDGLTWTTISGITNNSFTRANNTQTLVNPTTCLRLEVSGDKIAVDENQLEAAGIAPTPTSPITTTTVTVTRAAETASMAIVMGAANALTLQANYIQPIAPVGAQTLVEIDDGSTTNRLVISLLGSTGTPRSSVLASGVNWASQSASGASTSTLYRQSASVISGFFNGYLNGFLLPVSTNTGTPLVPPGINTLRFGTTSSGTQPAFMILERVTVWRQGQSAAQQAHNTFGGW